MHAKSLQLYLTLSDPVDHSLPGSSCPWDSLGKNIGVGCHFLLQGIFLMKGLNPCLLKFPALAGRFFNTSAPWEIHINLDCDAIFKNQLISLVKMKIALGES